MHGAKRTRGETTPGFSTVRADVSLATSVTAAEALAFTETHPYLYLVLECIIIIIMHFS